MKKTLLIIATFFSLNATNAQVITQDFEGPLSISWDGSGSIVGNQGNNFNTHSGGGMYKFGNLDYLHCFTSLSPVIHYIGVWVNHTASNTTFEINLYNGISGNFICNVGSNTPPFYDGVPWKYLEHQLGSAYSGNYDFVFKSLDNYSQFIYIDDITISDQSATTITELSFNDFKIYPNPSINGKFNIAFRNAMDNINIEVFDLTGKLVQSENVIVFANENKEINAAPLSKGIYICKISNGTSHSLKKIVVL